MDWSEVERVKAYYAPWQEERLILDAVDSLEENVMAAVRYVFDFSPNATYNLCKH